MLQSGHERLLNDLSKQEELQLNNLIGDFKKAPIRPMDIYNLNRASLASVMGTVLTYLIVLLQFKVAEMGI